MSAILPLIALSNVIALNNTGFNIDAFDTYNFYRSNYWNTDTFMAIYDEYSQYNTVKLVVNGTVTYDNPNYFVGPDFHFGYSAYSYNPQNINYFSTLEENDSIGVFTNFQNGYNDENNLYYQTFTCEVDFYHIPGYVINEDISELYFYFCVSYSNREIPISLNISSCELFTYNSGDITGFDDGYNAGYYDGFTNGYDEGYVDGSNADNNLLDLIIAVPDRFIDSFKTIFDFEIFGVNIFSFMVSIISLGFVIYIIRKVAS